ncbi:MAG: hypothetical protein Q9181_004216 [Wetmoreana brouardii]
MRPVTEVAVEGQSQYSPQSSWDSKAERRVLRKCDFHVIPILYVLYMLSYLDRINIGNARIEGLERDLGMTANDYNIAVQVFFVPYILLEVPSNIMLRRVAPSAWLSSIMFIWGTGPLLLIALKFLAYALAKMDGLGGYAGWRWIFIIEGLLTLVVAVASKWLIVDWPEDARFLNDGERALLLRRLENDKGFAKMDKLDKRAIKRIIGDWKIWVGGLMYFGTCVSNYSISYYLPTVLSELGYSASDAQVQTIPIYAAGLVAALVTAWTSDRLRHRFSFVIVGAGINVIGYIVLLAQANVSVKVRYMALYLIECGLWIGAPVAIVWVTSNLGGHYKRAVGSGIVVAMANMSGFVSSNIFIPGQAPRYPVGYGVALAMTAVAALAGTVLYLGMRQENRRRERGERDHRLLLEKEQLDNVGDEHPDFRYAL